MMIQIYGLRTQFEGEVGCLDVVVNEPWFDITVDYIVCHDESVKEKL